MTSHPFVVWFYLGGRMQYVVVADPLIAYELTIKMAQKKYERGQPYFGSAYQRIDAAMKTKTLPPAVCALESDALVLVPRI